MGEKSYYDGVETSPDEIYAWCDEHRTTPKTSAITIESAVDFLKSSGADINTIIASLKEAPPDQAVVLS